MRIRPQFIWIIINGIDVNVGEIIGITNNKTIEYRATSIFGDVMQGDNRAEIIAEMKELYLRTYRHKQAAMRKTMSRRHLPALN